MPYIILPLIGLFVAFMCLITSGYSDTSEIDMFPVLTLFVLAIVDVYRTDTEDDYNRQSNQGPRCQNWNVNHSYNGGVRNHRNVPIVDNALRNLMNKSKNIKITDNGRITESAVNCNTDASAK